MSEPVKLTYTVAGDDFVGAGAASGDVKRTLKKLGLAPEIVKRVSICMYEGELNMVIHANGGVARVELWPTHILIDLRDTGPGIPDMELAMQEGYSTASEDVRNLGFGAGMGLPNMKRYADELSIFSKPGEGTRVVMRICL